MQASDVTHLEEPSQENGQVLHKLLFIIGALLIRLGDVSSDWQHCHKLVHEDDIQLYELSVCLRTHRQTTNLHVHTSADDVMKLGLQVCATF